jgi:hypothetical protein
MARDDDRYCSNCRAPIPRGAGNCPSCGMYAGDVFDGKIPRQQKRSSSGFWIILLLLTAAGGGAYWYWMHRSQIPRADTGPVRVVGDRPGGARRAAGAAINEPEAMMTLRHHFAEQEHPIRSECIAVISKGFRDGHYTFDAVNSCDRTRLGRWKVDAKTKAVSQ